MPTFAYSIARNAPPAGTIDAADRQGAVRTLLDKGIRPVEVTPVARGTRASAATARGATVSRGELVMLIRELATALSAGLPLVTALRTMGGTGRSTGQRRMIEHVIGHVESGKSLAEAMSTWGKPFGDLIVSMTRAGEAAGRLSEVLSQAANLLERDAKVRRAVASATVYPAFLAVLSSAAVAVVVAVIVPRLMKPFQGSAREMPWMTQILMGIGESLNTYWWAYLLAIVAGTFGFLAWYQSPEGRLRFDRFILRVPVLGTVMRDVAVARFTRTLATLVASGLPLLQALRVTKGTLGNRAMEKVIDTVTEKVTQGRTLAEPLEKSGYFPPMLVQVVALGERSGRLEETMSQAASAFEERSENSIKVFTTVLPLVLVIVMAAVVGFIVTAILLTMLDMQDALLQGM